MLDQLVVIVSVTALVMVNPGPDMILVARNTFAGGRGAGLQTSLGVLSGNLVHIAYCVCGIGVIISRSILAFAVLKYAAAAYLVYLGVMSFRSSPSALAKYDAQGHRSHRAWLAQGFVNNLLNPKGTLFYLGVFTTVITPDTSAGGVAVLVLSMLMVSASFWLLFVWTLDRRFIRDSLDRYQQAAQRTFGALLILLGVRVAVTSR